jgi:hypothetical protein
MDPNQDRRRGHFHRGRRGSDRRGFDRRPPAQPQPPQGRDQVDVEQIMREIRARIAHQQGVELSSQQIDELAARRLEYVLDPRAMKPEFLDRLRRSADEAAARHGKRLPAEPVYVFEDTTLYDSHRAILRFIRRLLNPLLKLFFNPNPLIRALHLQAKLNVEAAERNEERDRRQDEWNALHYAIVQRLVTEMSRLSLDVQALATRVESLGARVDFADRRVRAAESAVPQSRPGGRPPDTTPARLPDVAAAPPAEGAPAAPEGAHAESGRRRRRRRRGRRGGGLGMESAPTAGLSVPAPATESPAEEPIADEEPLSGQGPTGEEPVTGEEPEAAATTATAAAATTGIGADEHSQPPAESPVPGPAPDPAPAPAVLDHGDEPERLE